MAAEDGVQAVDEGAAPTLDRFHATCREALTYLAAYGFREVHPHKHRADDSFRAWFAADERVVLVRGEGWGTTARITLEHSSGVHLPVIYLVPREARPGRRKKHGKRNTQLEQIREEAGWLQQYGEDFLSGDLRRFLELAKPLPSYLRPPELGRRPGGTHG